MPKVLLIDLARSVTEKTLKLALHRYAGIEPPARAEVVLARTDEDALQKLKGANGQYARMFYGVSGREQPVHPDIIGSDNLVYIVKGNTPLVARELSSLLQIDPKKLPPLNPFLTTVEKYGPGKYLMTAHSVAYK